jgi:glycosyltransferase involved in cell wall biosynthesis
MPTDLTDDPATARPGASRAPGAGSDARAVAAGLVQDLLGGRGPVEVAAWPGTVPAVDVILPVYNEAGLIRRTFEAVEAFALGHPEYGFTFVDDGSSDDTGRTLRTLIAGTDVPERRLRLISYAPNRGKGRAVREGIERSESPIVLFTDGDLAYPLDHLPRLVEALGRADVVIGSRSLVARAERNTTLPRRVMGWAFNRCARVVLGLRHRDTQAGLKGFRSGAARAIFARQRLGGFAFDVELVYLARRLGFTVAEVPAFVAEGHSYKRSKVNLLRDPATMFGALLQVRLNALRGRYGPR